MFGKRFVVFCDGEDQEIGIMQGLDSFDVSDDMSEILLDSFDRHLPIPDIFTKKRDKSFDYHSFFTEKGMKFFKDDIERLVDYWENYLMCEIVEIDFSNDAEVIYLDDFQFVIAKKC